ncbi:hypothetical protein GUJ93_ZPchr0008g12933 [Zizania palustris]|uniref:Uncharacterized protein n=1 Tax=Zizania palustris TaxID=103762 RepID=A0A8J5V1M6_ZIZPA|nr:hypothetical protein GUJ93_ZPchr0008g12933 [Zizania palustris]
MIENRSSLFARNATPIPKLKGYSGKNRRSALEFSLARLGESDLQCCGAHGGSRSTCAAGWVSPICGAAGPTTIAARRVQHHHAGWFSATLL